LHLELNHCAEMIVSAGSNEKNKRLWTTGGERASKSKTNTRVCVCVYVCVCVCVWVCVCVCVWVVAMVMVRKFPNARERN
jgi:Flp pilus assembly protein TadB